MEILRELGKIVSILFFLCYFYQLVYIFVPLLKKERPHRDETLHRYAVLIAARNESAVIGGLIGSLKAQDYPEELVTIFVVADNCTDDTALVARRAGAVVYERFDNKKVGKGYALDFLLRRIRRDHGSGAFDGFFVFDADNILSRDYITQMNRTFSDGYRIVTSRRNSKNFGDNWVSAGYALWFLRESEFLNRPRMLLGTSAAVSGTGFMFSSGLIDECGGWNFFLLTEDIEFTVYNVLRGEKIGYCRDAVFYDEQPTRFSQSWRQRLRWAKGYLQVFSRYGGRLVGGAAVKPSFSCFDMAMAIMPAIVLAMAGSVINLVSFILAVAGGGAILTGLAGIFSSLVFTYVFMFVIGAITTVSQWRDIHTTTAKKILYTFTFPVFMPTYIPISIAALFARVEWRPIEHSVNVSLKDIERRAA